MRVPLSWLAEFVDVELTPEELAERLTLLGMEVKGIERWGADWDNVVTGELLTVEFAFPARDHQGGDGVAHEVGERPTFRHEPVDPQDKRHAGHRHGRDGFIKIHHFDDAQVVKRADQGHHHRKNGDP